MPIEQAANAFFNSLYAGFRLPRRVPLFQQGRRIATSTGKRTAPKIAFYGVSGDQALVVEFERKKL